MGSSDDFQADNQPVFLINQKKRKRNNPRATASAVKQQSTDTLNDSDHAALPKTIPKKRKGSTSTELTPAELEQLSKLSAPMQRLWRVFKSVNLIGSFIQAQRQVVCTLDTLKSGVDPTLRGTAATHDRASSSSSKSSAAGGLYADDDDAEEMEGLRLSDLGCICVVLPHVLELSWMERKILMEGSVTEMAASDVGFRSAVRRGGGGGGGDVTPVDVPDFALVVEFTDMGPVKSGSVKSALDAKGRPINPMVSLVKETAKQSFSIPTLTKLIEQRDRKFARALLAFVKTTEDQTSLSAVPVEPGSFFKPVTTQLETNAHNDLGLLKLLEDLKTVEFYKDQIPPDGWFINNARPSVFAPLTTPLSATLASALLSASNITQLYTHQAQAINALEAGHNVVVATSTSSGKSLIYQIPVLRELEKNPNARAIFIFPTKALAQDQKRSLSNILSFCGQLSSTEMDTYDGDTSWSNNDRCRIRDRASVIFTNPDMLHVSVLPQHKRWKYFLQELRFVIVDELHYYSGRFGVNCAMVMRRLRRICAFYGNYEVRFICCSATIANPVEHMKAFFGIDNAKLINEDGSPCGLKHQIVWNPPYRNPEDPRQGRTSLLEEGVTVCSHFAQMRVRFICFAKVRSMCELLIRELQAHLRAGSHPGLADKIMSYRGGYSPEDRREIESKMFRGELIGIIATNALELGVDIGSLDAVIHLGYPFNLASYRQQLGRAGRREKDSVSLMITAGDNPLDQFYASNPSKLFGGSLETVHIDISNDMIVEGHLQCTANEIPILPEDFEIWFGAAGWRDGGGGDDVIKPGQFLELGKQSLLWDPHHNVFHAARQFQGAPAKAFHIRGCGDDDNFRVIDVTTHRDLEEMEDERAPFQLYEGSILMHQGRSYLVFDVNVDRRYAKVRPTNVDYMTAVRDYTNVDPLFTEQTTIIYDRTKVEANTTSSGCVASIGHLTIRTVCFGYFKLHPFTRAILETCSGLESDPIVRNAHGFWIDVPSSAVTFIEENGKIAQDGIHAASHVLLSLLPKVVMIPTSGQTDIRTDCPSPQAVRYRPPRICIYESLSTGILEKAFSRLPDLIFEASSLIENCSCEEGCPECILRSVCKERNTGLDKWAASMIFRGILGRPFV